jgi:hypothetical protein
MTQQTLFNVRVPVLSLHIVVADPIVSHDESRLTYLNDTKSNHIVPPVVSFLYKYMHKHIFFIYQSFVSHHLFHGICKPEKIADSHLNEKLMEFT